MPAVSRGHIVLIDFPYSDGRQGKIRPAVIIQADAQNAALKKTIVAMITGNLRRRSEPTHVFLDPRAEPCLGIHGQSLISCINLYTLDQTSVLRIIGQVTPAIQSQLDSALKNALSL
jgi:mRNA-degrading endonuclease toxin of MazEF toxin-antitoxin module